MTASEPTASNLPCLSWAWYHGLHPISHQASTPLRDRLQVEYPSFRTSARVTPLRLSSPNPLRCTLQQCSLRQYPFQRYRFQQHPFPRYHLNMMPWPHDRNSSTASSAKTRCAGTIKRDQHQLQMPMRKRSQQNGEGAVHRLEHGTPRFCTRGTSPPPLGAKQRPRFPARLRHPVRTKPRA